MIRILVVAAILLLATGCSGDGNDAAPSPSPAQPTPAANVSWPTSGWEISSPAAEGMSAEALGGLDGVCKQIGCQAVVVTRHGRIVWEQYAPGLDQFSTFIGYSMAKSFTSALVGIALEDGQIKSIDQPVADFIADWRGGDKQTITLRHIMSLTSGLEWNEGYTGVNDVTSMVQSRDHVQYVLDRPVAVPPGERFHYSTGDPAVLSRVLKVATGEEAKDMARERIFDVIGMPRAVWPTDPAGQTLTYCCITTTAREFAKFGYLYLRNGNWDGKQVVPESWVRESTQPSQDLFPQYGLLWWLPDFPDAPKDTIQARGIQARHIFIIPSLDIVAVRIGTADVADNSDGNAFLAPIVRSVQQAADPE